MRHPRLPSARQRLSGSRAGRAGCRPSTAAPEARLSTALARSGRFRTVELAHHLIHKVIGLSVHAFVFGCLSAKNRIEAFFGYFGFFSNLAFILKPGGVWFPGVGIKYGVEWLAECVKGQRIVPGSGGAG